MSFFVTCPHCNLIIEILEINCAIFRHGVYKNNFQQINPHSSKEFCDYAIQNNLIHGCGLPFKIVKVGNEYTAIVCDYI